MNPYKYTESGLDNVWIQGIQPLIDDEGELVLLIRNPILLHKAIAKTIVSHPKGMSGKELRFLRTEIGLTQAELAKIVHCDAQTIARWEKGQTPIDSAAEAIIRMHVIQTLGLDVASMAIADISEGCSPNAEPQPIVINGNDPYHYSAVA